MIKVAVIEDNDTEREHLCQLIATYAHNHNETIETHTFTQATSFLDPYQAIWDVVFMDIEMPYLDGLSAAKRLRELDTSVVLVFVTNMAQYASNGYQVQALDYVVKPLQEPVFSQKMDRALGASKRQGGSIVMTYRGITNRVSVRDIVSLQARGHLLIVHTVRGQLTCRDTLQRYEAELAKQGCIRVSKSCMVNASFIHSVNAHRIVLTDGSTLCIGRAFKTTFMSQLARQLGQEMVI